MQRMWVQSLVGELRSHVLQSNQAHVPQLEKPANQNEKSAAAPKKRRGSQMLEVTGHGVLFPYSPFAEKQVSQAPEMPEEVYVLCLPLLRG